MTKTVLSLDRIGIVTSSLLFLLIHDSCSPLMQSEHQGRYEKYLQPLLHYANKQEFLNHYGPPARKAVSDDREGWLYFFPVPESEYSILDDAVPDGKHPDLYDCLTLYFDSSGTFVDWRVVVSQIPDERLP